MHKKMIRYLIIPLLSLIFINAYGQFNKNSRTINKSDTTSYLELGDGISQRIKPAEFPGGMAGFYKYVSRKLKLPKDAKEQKVRGSVIVQFVIDTNGNVKKESVKVIQSLLESCDTEAVRLITNSPTWTPAINLVTNKAVEIQYSMPIRFHSY